MDWFGLQGSTHRAVSERLVASGWDVCGVGDWAVVWRSPDGRQVARVCAFEPAYGVFVRLCRELGGHPMLPRVDFDAELAGGGRLTVMEFLLRADAQAGDALLARWDAAAAGDPVAEVRAAAERIAAEAALDVPFWGGLDHNPGNVMRRASGDPVLVDLFFADGVAILQALAEDPATVAAAFPAERRAFLTEIAAIARESTPEEIAALRAAADSIS